MTDEVGCRMRAPDAVHGLPITSKFIQRVVSVPLIDCVITGSTGWYQKMKKATPSMIRRAITSVEMTTVLILGRLISLILAFPLPFGAADAVACRGLDFLEMLADSKAGIVRRLRESITGEDSSTPESAYLNLLLKFENDMRDMAVGEIKTTVQAFLDTQIALFDRINDAIESFYEASQRTPDASNGEAAGAQPTGVSSSSFQRVKQTFDEVMEQRNLVVLFSGTPSPLEPAWEYLQRVTQALNPEELKVQELSKLIYFMRLALCKTVHQVKQASRSTKTCFIGAQSKKLAGMIRLALKWLPISATTRLERITGCEIIDGPRKKPEATQDLESGPISHGSDASSDTVVDSDGTVVDGVQREASSDAQEVGDNEPPADEATDGNLGTLEEASTETDDSSDQHSNGGSSEIETSNDGNQEKSSRAGRRRRKKSLNC